MTRSETFPIVGVGASAGGLAAISELLHHLPPGIQIAVVVVQHLSPQHESFLPALIAKATRMPVDEVCDGMRVVPGRVYVLPPDHELEVHQGRLKLVPRSATEPQFCIDRFFRSLAQDQQSRAIGVVLSGSATDGAQGLRAIEEVSGVTFAQEPSSAQFDSMPNAAIDMECVDFVMTPRDIAAKLRDIVRYSQERSGEQLSPQDGMDVADILAMLRRRYGNDFSQYKRRTVERRIRRRMMLNHIKHVSDYVSLLESHGNELDALFRDLLIGVTAFFRDAEAFNVLKEKILTPMIRLKSPDEPIRIWVAGCATGEEVYSIAISLVEALGERAESSNVQIFGTDVNAEAIDKARLGVYPENIEADVSRQRLERFFVKVDQGYRAAKGLRDMCIFAPQNLLKDPPFSHLDLICCRNMLIYLDKALQSRLLRIFHYALKPDGVLFLGSSESTGDAADLFTIVDNKYKMYRKKYATIRPRYDFAATAPDSAAPTQPRVGQKQPELQVSLHRRLEQLALSQFTPPGAVVSEDMEVVFFLGHNGRYLDPEAGRASLNLMKLIRRELVTDLRIVFNTAVQDHSRCTRSNVRLGDQAGAPRCTIEVLPLMASDQNYYFVVSFRDEAAPAAPVEDSTVVRQASSETERNKELERELMAVKEYVQTVIEKHEATNEELQSANEEIQSANEELQSTNEELETAREELQSTNEELATVNQELELRNEELSSNLEEMNSLLVSVSFPIVMLDEKLDIRRFTLPAQKVFNLIDSDVGRPFSDINPKIDLPDLRPMIQEVMRSQAPKSREVHDRSSGAYFDLHIHPYGGGARKPKGCVLVLVDVTAVKQAQQLQRLATVVRDSNDAILVQNLAGIIEAWNPRASQIYGYSEEEALGRDVEILLPEDRRAEQTAIRSALLHGENLGPIRTRRITKNGDVIDMLTLT